MMQTLSVSKEAFSLLSTSKMAAVGMDIKVYSSGGGVAPADQAAAGQILYQYNVKTYLQLLVIQAEPRVVFLLLLELDPLLTAWSSWVKGSARETSYL